MTMNIRYSIFLVLVFTALSKTIIAQSFVHPGLLHSREDIERMREAIIKKHEPVYSGFMIFHENPVSKHTYKMQGPMSIVGRNPTVGQSVYDTDANAAHQNAVMWAITGEKAYAEKAREIINAWSSTLKSITGRDAVLMAGLGPFKMINAAEILRYTNSGWPEAEISQTEKHFKEVIYPVIKDFAPFANGNWDAAAIKTVMAIGVFCNDREIFERALRYYVNGHGNGCLTNYIINEDGQVQESGRDQGHTQLGIGMLAECAEIAWHQGLDLYGYANNRLLKGFEYVSKFNLGKEVPFTETLDRTGKYHHKTIARQDRGPLRAVYEQVYNHYVNRAGMAALFTQQAAEKIRPEGPGKPGADHPGYGTLFFTRPKVNAGRSVSIVPAAPGAIIADGVSDEIKLVWVAPVGAIEYTVKRSEKKNGPYTVIARSITENTYTDKAVKAGRLYFYTVTASNVKGESRNAAETAISAGTPLQWQQKTIGKESLKGKTQYNGHEFRVEGGGIPTDSLTDQLHFTYTSLKGDGQLIARFVPQPSSQFSRFGLMVRESLSDNSVYGSLLICPGKTAQIEAPAWHLQFITRKEEGKPSIVKNISSVLPDPVVTYGRLTGTYWLKLVRKNNTLTGYGSLDGKEWSEIGTATIPLTKNIYMGLSVSSGLKEKTTTILFDHVSLK